VLLAALCREDASLRAELNERLLLRGTSLNLAGEDRFETFTALLQAVQHCEPATASGAADNERALTSWLGFGGTRGRAAARALGAQAARDKNLSAETLVALLGSVDEFPSEAWFALAQVSYRAPSFRETLLNKAEGALHRGAHEVWLVHALRQIVPESVPLLASLARGVNTDSSQALRSTPHLQESALSALGAAGPKAQAALGSLLSDDAWRSSQSPSIVARLLGALEPQTAREHRGLLKALSNTPLPSDALGRADVIQLRCVAASLLEGPGSPALERCDPEAGEPLARATLMSIKRTGLSGAGVAELQKLLKHPIPRVHQEALQLLLVTQPEPRFAESVLTAALGHPNAGTVAVAARVIRDLREQGNLSAPGPELIQALTGALEADVAGDAVATRVSVLGAVSALQILSLKTRVLKHCDSPYAAVRNASAQGLARLRSSDRCPPAFRSKGVVPGAATHELRLFTRRNLLTLQLALDSHPLHAARLTELVSRGAFVGNPLTGDDRGLQFGDPDGDGFANSPFAPIASELSSARFEPLSVGMAQSGPDSASTQLFVTRMQRPDLDLRYTHLGWASESWTTAERGDVIEKVELSKLAP
jgi:cyclophilin family peptidyl-prolyl cis-trans isomerase